jgi:predicted dehydrogenase
MSRSEGMNYAPQGKAKPVCGPNEFPFAAIALDHGHIHGQCRGLIEAGGGLRYVYDPDPEKVEDFRQKFPEVKVASSEAEILDDPEIKLIAAAAVPCDRGPLGCRVMKTGKDYFTDKTPFTSLDQLDEARKITAETGRKYMVYYGERLHNEAGVHAGTLIEEGIIGRVIQVLGLGPHRLTAPRRPQWFFEKEKYGGILCDIGSHQAEQFLSYSGARDATVKHAVVANYAHPDYPELEDYGEASFIADNGCTNYFRVDWFTPDGLRNWGDGRTLILGTEGYIELRKYIDVGQEEQRANNVYLVTGEKEHHFNVTGQVGFPFFGELILDCLNRTEKAMTQEHAFKAAELCLQAQNLADQSGMLR